MIVSEKAPAKINLFLHVTGRRPDGYHTLSSLVVFSRNHFDLISIEPAQHFAFDVQGCPALEQEKDSNLVVRAAQALAVHTGRPLNCRIVLQKNLPVAGGVGGGSSNAAAAIRALEKFWARKPLQKNAAPPPPVRDARFDAMLLSLGADVPVCYFGRPCLMRGIGEVIEPLPFDLPEFTLELHPSGRALRTADVFAAFRGPFAPDLTTADLPQWRSADDMCLWLSRHTVNSLEAAALSLLGAEFFLPGKGKPATERAGHSFVRMSGSGPTFFEIPRAMDIAAPAPDPDVQRKKSL